MSCSMKRMQRQTKRGTNVFFIPEGLGSSKTVNNKKWKLDTLDGFMDRFGHSKVSHYKDIAIVF